MKINQSKEDQHLEELGQARVFRAESTSSPGSFHYVFAYNDSRGIQCTCRGWRIHKNCWHVRAVPTQIPQAESCDEGCDNPFCQHADCEPMEDIECADYSNDPRVVFGKGLSNPQDRTRSN